MGTIKPNEWIKISKWVSELVESKRQQTLCPTDPETTWELNDNTLGKGKLFANEVICLPLVEGESIVNVARKARNALWRINYGGNSGTSRMNE